MSKESRRAARAAAREATGGTASSGPAGTARAGRRQRSRRVDRRSLAERYRNVLVGGGAVLAVALLAGFVFLSQTGKAYACSTEWDPAPAASPAAGASPRLGFAQDSMGNSHEVRRPQRYTLCPPATGTHYAENGLGPIEPRVYRPDDNVGPANWIHNLEHGGMVILYRGDSPGATEDGLAAFRQFYDSFPPSPICNFPPRQLSPVVARFDEMTWPYAALVWGRVLPLETWDPALALEFYATESERLDADGVFVAPPEPRCAAPSPSPGAGGSPAAPSASPSPASGSSAAPSASPSPS